MLTSEEREVLNNILIIKKKNKIIFECQYKSIAPGNNKNIIPKGVDFNGYIEYVCKET